MKRKKMKIVKFEDRLNKERDETIKDAKEILERSTHFILCYSEDNLDKWGHSRFNLTAVEAIGCLDVSKHRLLHDVLSEDPDDGDEEDMPACGGKV
jgi:hypothetical protein